MGNNIKPFSIVTTCRNEIKSLPRWKQNILDQTRSPHEIVVVDAFSDDGTYEFLHEWSVNDTRLLLIQEKGAAAKGRNIAIDNATNDYILSTDMGVRLENTWCEKLITPFEENTSVEVVAGNTCIDIETIKSNTGWAEYYLEKGGYANLVEGHIPGNRSIAYKKKIWEELGGLPEELTFYADDSVFGRQLVQGTYNFAFAPKAMTYWGRHETLSQYFHEHFVYGKGDGEALIKTPRAFKLFKDACLPKELVPILSLFISLTKVGSWKGIAKAFAEGKILAALLIPVLSAGRSYYYSKGYVIGYELGNAKCRKCRARLERDSKGYSVY